MLGDIISSVTGNIKKYIENQRKLKEFNEIQRKSDYNNIFEIAFPYLNRLREKGFDVSGSLKLNYKSHSFCGANFLINDKKGPLLVLDFGDEFEFKGIEVKRESARPFVYEALEGVIVREFNPFNI